MHTEQARRILLAVPLRISLLLAVASCHQSSDPLQSLVKAIEGLEHRPLTARFAACPYRPAPPRNRSASAQDVDTLTAKAAAAALLQRGNASADTSAFAMLIVGDLRKAVSTLETLAQSNSNSPVYWSDLAAARLELATKEDAMEVAGAALAAADRALRIAPNYEPALFNRALALDALGLRPHAVRALKRYCIDDPGSPWAEEARLRQATTGETSLAQEWKQAKTVLEREEDVDTIVSRLPQQTRTFAESAYLAQWAEAFTKHDAASAEHALRLARAIGSAQVRQRDEHLLTDAVTAIDRSTRVDALANAYLVYKKGRLLYSTASGKVFEALPHLKAAEAQFEAAGSPMSLVAAYYQANALFDAHDSAAASAILERLRRSTPASYRALRAQLDWLESTISAHAGRPHAALRASLDAARQFRELGEWENAARMEMASSTAMGILGRHPEEYRWRRRAFESASSAGNAALWEVILNSAARDEARAGHWDVSASLFGLELEGDAVSPLVRFDALLWGSVARSRASALEAPDLSEARNAAGRVSDPAIRADMENELRYVEAMWIRDTDPRRAIELLSSVIDFRLKVNRIEPIAAAYIERGHAYGADGRRVEQEHDLRQAIEWSGRAADEIRSDDLRDAFFGAHDDAYDALVHLFVTENRFDEALTIAEQKRARGLTPLSLTLRQPPADTIIAHYTTLEQRSLIVALSASHPPIFYRASSRAELLEQVHIFTEAIIQNDVAMQLRAGARLYDALIAPIEPQLRSAHTLIVVPDDTLSALPFAALKSPAGRYLVEDVAIVVAPAASTFLSHAKETPTPSAAYRNLAVVADPAFDPATFPDFQRLPSARNDLHTLAVGRRSVAVTDAEATPSRVKGLLESFNAVHIAAHAVVDSHDAWRSLVLLSPDRRSDGALYLHEIRHLNLQQLRVVTLAGCRTALPGGSAGSVSSLSRAFLAAGAHNVVATLWDVDDSATSILTTAFFRALTAGEAPAEALRSAQLFLMHSGNSAWESPQHWSSVQLYGCNR